MAYTSKDIEKEKKKTLSTGLTKDKVSYAVTQGANAASLIGGAAKQAGNTLKKAGYTAGLVKTALNKPGDYQASDEVNQANAALKEHYNSKPGEYQSSYADQIQGLLKDYENTKDFQYDFNADPLYQLYKDQYIQNGKMAMMDTMANASALTGGYGSSYASSAGNQAYQASLGELNSVIPDLYDRAYARYRDDKSDKLQHMQVLQSLDEADYQKYQDTLSDYYNTLNYLQNQAQYLSESDYNRYLDKLEQWQYELEYYTGRVDAAQQQSNWQSEHNHQVAQDALAQRNWQNQFDYQKEQDALAQSNWQQEFDYGKEQDALAQKNWQAQFDYNKEQDALAQQNWQTEFDYQKQQDNRSQSNWERQFNHQVSQDALSQSNWEKEYALTKAAASQKSSGSSSGSSSSSYSASSDNSGSQTISSGTQKFIKNNQSLFAMYEKGMITDEQMEEALYNAYVGKNGDKKLTPEQRIDKATYLELMEYYEL